jgi:colanic acid/amylovoran biosynthesis glycosyltransferase
VREKQSQEDAVRIAYVFTDLPDAAGTFAFAELEEMARRGLRIEIFCLRSLLAMGPGARSLRERFVVHSSPYISLRAVGAMLGICLRRPGLFWRSLGAAVKETASNPRILIKTLAILPKCCLFARDIRRGRFHFIQAYWASLPGRAAWWISLFTGTPYGTWAHAGADIYNRDHQTERALRTTLQGAAQILTCNLANVTYFRTIVSSEVMARVRHHPHGIDLSLFRPKEEGEAPPRLDLQLVSVGRVSEAKGFAYAVRACRLLLDRGVDFHYRIIGGGAGSAQIETLINSLGLSERITLPGPVEQHQLPAEYRAADVFLMPSIVGKKGSRDGLPNVLLEAMACGVASVGLGTWHFRQRAS